MIRHYTVLLLSMSVLHKFKGRHIAPMHNHRMVLTASLRSASALSTLDLSYQVLVGTRKNR